MVVNGFLRTCLNEPLFRNIVSAILNDKENKKFVSAFKDWLKDLSNAINNIKSQKIGWWKKVKRQYGDLTARDVDNEVKPGIKESLSLLNSIIEKHPIENVSESL